MDDALPAIALGTGRTATAITAGWGHTCARLDDGVRKCWGGNIRGELGLGDRTNRGNGPGEMGDALLPANGVPAMSVTILADHTAVEAGEDIGYDVTVTNTGTTLLSQIRVQAPDVPDCAANPPDLLPGQQHVVECSYTTTPDDVPQMTNQVLVTSRQADPVLSGTRRTRVIEEAIRPDAQIRVGNGAFIGTTTYNTTGSGQSRSATVGNQGTATFTGRIQNDGNVTDDITLLGQPTTSRYTVTYKDGPTNITAQVTAGTYTIDDLAPGATHDITIQIKAKAGTPVGNQVTRTLTATSGADPDLDDTVKTTVRRT